MARTIAQIKQQIIDNVNADPVLNTNLTSTSKRALFGLWAFIVAVAASILEQLMDIYSAQNEAVALRAAPASAPWLQDQILKFQYSLTTPQVIQLIGFAPAWPVVDETMLITSRCSVLTTISGSVLIKVATGEPPSAFTSDQITALSGFVRKVGVPGVTYTIQSNDPDQLYIQADVYFLGQYASAIQNNVIAAINNFLVASNTKNFDGTVLISDLEIAIRNAQGVTDVMLKNVYARSAGTAFADGTALILNQQALSRLWPTVAGYMISETTAGKTLADSLTFLPQ
jgi:hypothetical protein